MNTLDNKLPDFEPKQDFSDAYFDGLADSVFSKLELENEVDLPAFLKKDGLKKSPFLTPKNYFEKLESQVFEKIEAQKLEDELPDFLKNEQLKTTPFSIPKSYFENLEQPVFEKIAARKTHFLPRFEKIGGLKTMLAMAASIALLIVAAWFLNPKKVVEQAILAEKEAACETSKCLVETLTEADLETFLDENLDDFDAEDLAEAAQIARAEPTKKAKKRPLDDLDLNEKDVEFLIDELDAEDLEEML